MSFKSKSIQALFKRVRAHGARQFTAWIPLLAVLWLPGFAAHSQVDGLPEFDAVYAAQIDGVDIGISERAFRKDSGGQVAIAHTLQVNALMQLLGVDPVAQISSARVGIDGRVRPERFFYSEKTGGENLAEAVFDWHAGELFAAGGPYDGNRYSLPENAEILDFESWYLAHFYRPIEHYAEHRIGIAEIDKTRVYVYGPPRREMLDTAIGQFDTVRLTMARVNRKKQRFVVWIAPQMRNLPVRIQRIKGDRTLDLRIRQINWLD